MSSPAVLDMGGTNIGGGGVMHPPPFSHFSVFTVLTPHLQIRGAALGFRILLKSSGLAPAILDHLGSKVYQVV